MPAFTIGDVEKLLREKISVIEIEVRDDSKKHRLHPQSTGGHFQVRIISDDFVGLDLVSRHRVVYEALNVQMANGIHALAIEAWTSSEWLTKKEMK